MKNRIIQAAFFLTLFFVAASCNNDDNNTIPEPGRSELVDHGYLPVPVDGQSDFGTNEFQLAAYNNNFVFVATTDGLWKNNLATREWSRSGFDGKKVSLIFKHPTIANKLFAGIAVRDNQTEKSLFISNDGGATWTAADAPVRDDLEKVYETYVSMAVRPNNPDHIYANLEGGAMIAVSTDGGKNWKRMNNAPESYFGYRSNIVFIPGNANQIFQGSENPLDDAWLGRYDIDAKDPVKLSNFTKIVDMDVFENRRPVELQAHSFTGNSIYVGQEAALSKITQTTTKFIFKSDEENTKFPYAYIYGFWIDPKDPNHILFGGSVNGENRSLSLFETFDEGKEITQFTGTGSLATAQIRKIVSTDKNPAIVLYDTEVKKVRLLVYNLK